MGYSHLGFIWGCWCIVVVAVLVSGSTINLPIIAFDEGYTHLFGDDNLIIHKDGKSVHLSLNERTGLYYYYHHYFIII